MQFLSDFFETKSSTNAALSSPNIKSVQNMNLPIKPGFVKKSQGKAAFMNMIKASPAHTQSVDNIDIKNGMMITELSQKENGIYGNVSGQQSGRSKSFKKTF